VLMPPIDVGAGLWTVPKMLPFLKLAVYMSMYRMAKCPQIQIA
jgi:hypothetical protein